MPMLRETYPHLEQAYAKMYRKTYAPEEYTKAVLSVVDRERRRWGLDLRHRDPAPKPVRGQLAFSLASEPPRRQKAAKPRPGQLELAPTA